jgi:thiamine kinase-like enzyme
MTGNISKVYVKDTPEGKAFVKKVPVDSFDTRTLGFQSRLRQIISGKFNINRYDSIEVKPENGELFYHISFEYIKEDKWLMSPENMSLIGKSMAIIHNYCYRNSNHIVLDKKENLYNDMGQWLTIPNSVPFKKESYEMRKEIFEKIERLNLEQPKIALHRDFKPHNIIADSEKLYLIDFDFASVDFASLEVMAFLVDIIERGTSLVKAFITSYLENIDIPIIFESIVDDYLNYLCVNAFPFYSYERLEPNNFKNLVEHRNNSLISLYNKRDIINDIILEIKIRENESL